MSVWKRPKKAHATSIYSKCHPQSAYVLTWTKPDRMETVSALKGEKDDRS
ncbi:MAG: hypothetical protein AAF629_23445 [Chloroflexota bacterium]